VTTPAETAVRKRKFTLPWLKPPQEKPSRRTAFATKSDGVGSTRKECLTDFLDSPTITKLWLATIVHQLHLTKNPKEKQKKASQKFGQLMRSLQQPYNVQK